MQNKTMVIGLVIEDVFTDFARELTESIKNSIPRNRDIRLVVLSGKYETDINVNDTLTEYRESYNSVYALAENCNIDGFIVHLSSIEMNHEDGRGFRLLQRLSKKPVVLICSHIDGFTTVGYNNKIGIREAIDSMVNANGITNICMLGGRDTNYEVRARKHIFMDCLKEHSITFRDRMYEATDMTVSTEEAAGRLIDRNPGVRGIFCVNDGSAVGLYKAMKKRGLVPGKDIYVFGFDNTKMASAMKPSLTSIGAGNVTLGQRAVEMLLAKIGGHDVRSEYIPTKLYGRASFPYTMYEHNIKGIMSVDKNFIYRIFDECFYRYGTGCRDRGAVDLRRLFYEIISRMLNSMNRRYVSSEEFVDICRLIDIFFSEGAMDYTDSEKLLFSINRLQENMARIQRTRGVTVNVLLNRIFLHMKDSALSALAERNTSDNASFRDADERLCRFMVNLASYSGRRIDPKQLFSSFGELGIKNAAVYLFNEPVDVKNVETGLPENISLVCAMKNGEFYMLAKERSSECIRDMFLRKELSVKCDGFITLPIFYRNIIYGYLLCELNDDIYSRGECISMMIGRSIYLNDLG